MPYREAEYRQSCRVCGVPTQASCCKCNAPLCSEHGRELAVQFYVRTIACADDSRCHSRAPKRRGYDEADEVMTPWGVSVKRYFR